MSDTIANLPALTAQADATLRRPISIEATIAKLRLAADILEAEDAVGDIPGMEVRELIERAGGDLKTLVINLQLG